MHTYEVDFVVNGIRSKQIVQAYSSLSARQIIEAQYKNNNFAIYSIKEIK
mgnify:CR=1 FL=1